MKKTSSKHLVSDLLNSKIVAPDGKVLGHVADIQLTHGPEYRVIGLIYGIRGELFRLHVLNPFGQGSDQDFQPHVIPWSSIESFAQSVVKLKPEYEVKELQTDH